MYAISPLKKVSMIAPQSAVAPNHARSAILSPERRRILELLIGPLILLAVWWIADVAQLVNKNLLPSPFATLHDIWRNLIAGSLAFDFWRTLSRIAYAFIAAALVGIPIGIVLGAKEPIYRSVEFNIDFFRSTPATAMFPLFMLLFGLGEFTKIALAAFAAFLVIVFNVAYGVMNARQTRILAARSMGASNSAYLHRRDLFRNATSDLCWFADRDIARSGRRRRRRNVYRRVRRTRPPHHRCANFLSVDRHVRLHPGRRRHGLRAQSVVSDPRESS